jgi:hypothetical protein
MQFKPVVLQSITRLVHEGAGFVHRKNCNNYATCICCFSDWNAHTQLTEVMQENREALMTAITSAMQRDADGFSQLLADRHVVNSSALDQWTAADKAMKLLMLLSCSRGTEEKQFLSLLEAIDVCLQSDLLMTIGRQLKGLLGAQYLLHTCSCLWFEACLYRV